MANTKSAKKRIRSDARKHLRNKSYRSRVKTMIKKAEQALENGVVDQVALRMAFSTLDKAAVKGIIHKNNAARRKSRLAQKAKRVALAAQAAQAGPAA